MLNRRSFLRTTGAVSLALATPTVLRAQDNVVNYIGYGTDLPAEFIRKFESETGIRVNFRTVDDQGKQYNTLLTEQSSPNVDVATVAAHRIPQFLKADLLQPLDVARLTGWGNVNPLYTEASWLTVEDHRWGVPLIVGAAGLGSNVERISEADGSTWGSLFDERFRDRISYVVLDVLSFAIAFQGNDLSFESYLGDEAKAKAVVDQARDFVIANKGLVLKYTESSAEVQQLFANDEIDVGQVSFGDSAKLIKGGFPFRFSIPKEGTYGFVRTLAISKRAPNAANAYRFIDALLNEPGIGSEVARSSGSITTFNNFTDGLTDDEKKLFAFSDEDLARIAFESPRASGLKYSLFDVAIAEIKSS